MLIDAAGRTAGRSWFDRARDVWSFWKEVASVISKVPAFTFTSLHLGYTPDKPSIMDACLLKIPLAASKRAVAKCWLQKNGRTAGVSVDIIKRPASCVERMTYSADDFRTNWVKDGGENAVFVLHLRQISYKYCTRGNIVSLKYANMPWFWDCAMTSCSPFLFVGGFACFVLSRFSLSTLPWRE